MPISFGRTRARDRGRGKGGAGPLVFQASFSSLTPDDLADLSSVSASLSYARSGAKATVQTSASTIYTNSGSGIAANRPRIFSDGTHAGLLVEESRTNEHADSRDMTAASWTSAGSQTGTAAQTGPDGVASARRFNILSTQFSQYWTPTKGAGTYTFSEWVKQGSAGTNNHQSLSYVNGGAVVADYAFSSGNAPSAWTRVSATPRAHTAGGLAWIPVDGRDWTANGGIGAGARDAIVDMHQCELGAFPTSFIITSGGTVTRGASILSTSADLRSGGALKLEAAIYPIAASTAYGSDQQLWYIDANNGAKIVQSSRKVAVTLGGSTVTLGVAIPAFSALDDVKLYVECGGGLSAHAWVSINGSVTDLGSSALAGNVPSGTLYLLNNSTAGVLSSVVRYIKAWRQTHMARPDWVNAYTARTVECFLAAAPAWDSSEDVVTANYRQRSSLACVARFYTSDTSVSVEMWSTMTGSNAGQAKVDVFSNGAFVASIASSGDAAANTQSTALPAGTSKLVEVYDSAQKVTAPTGTFVRRIQTPTSLSPISPTAPANRIDVLGDSKGCGFVVEPMSEGWIGLARASYASTGRITCHARGGESVYNLSGAGTSVATAVASLVAELDGTSTNTLWIDLGFNDYYGPTGTGIGGWTAATFKTWYKAIVSGVLVSRPNARIYCAYPTLWANEATTNGNAETLASIRSVIASAVSETANANVSAVDTTGTGWPQIVDLAGDGIHYTTTSSGKYHTKFRATIGY